MTESIVAAFNPSQKRDSDGEWSDGIPGPAADPLKLAGRIRLGPGERFGGSAVVDDGNHDLSTVLARVDGPDGTRIRVGVVSTDDKRRWVGQPKGATVELDGPGAADLQAAVRRGIEDGKASVAAYRAELRQAIKAGKPPEEWPDTETDIAKGTVRGSRWGDLDWTVSREEGVSFITVAGEEVIAADLVFSLTPRTTAGGPGGTGFETRSMSALKKLDKSLDDLTATVAASVPHTPGGGMAELLGVELARPGTWQIASGKRDFTPAMLRDAADFYAATGSQKIALGFGHLDSRFDGEPAFGWVDNVRYVEDDNGPVLLGDLVDMDDWVAAAAPKRWPKRSIEGVAGITYKGREYGLVLTRLALLGATPPGIPALKSLSDLRELVSAAVAESGAEWIAASTEAASTSSPPGADHPSDRKGAPGMPDAAKLRDALGLTPEASDDEVKASLAASGLVASQPEPRPAPEPAPQPEPTPETAKVSAAATPGVMTIAASVWDETQNTIKRLSAHVDETKRAERDTIIAAAVGEGKFTPAQKPHFAKLWDADPDGTRTVIENLTPNKELSVMATGYADADDDRALELEFANLAPPGFFSNTKAV